MQLRNKTTYTKNLEAKHISTNANIYNTIINTMIKFSYESILCHIIIKNLYMQNFFDYSPDGTALNHSFKLNINNQVLNYQKNTHFILKYLICLDCITVIRLLTVGQCITVSCIWWQQWQRLLDSLSEFLCNLTTLYFKCIFQISYECILGDREFDQNIRNKPNKKHKPAAQMTKTFD